MGREDGRSSGTRRSQHGGSQGNVVRTIPLHPGMIGLVVGKGGSTIKRLEKMSGVVSVKIQDNIVTVRARDERAADGCANQIHFLTSDKYPAFVEVVLDIGHRDPGDVALHFRKYDETIDRHLPDDNGRQIESPFMLSAGNSVDQLCSDFARISLDQNASDPARRFLQKQKIMLASDSLSMEHKTRGMSEAVEILANRLNSAHLNATAPVHDFLNHKNALGVDISLRMGNFTFLQTCSDQLPKVAPETGCMKQFSPKLRPEMNWKPQMLRSHWERVETQQYTTWRGTDCATGLKLFVRLALEGDTLKALDIAKDNRVSDEKKAAIQRVQQATTLFQVLGIENTGNITDDTVKKAYLKNFALLHPHKNGFLEATKALKRLDDAKNSLETLSGRKKMGAAEIQPDPVQTCTMPHVLPKVLGVTSDKGRIATLSTVPLTPGELGVRWVFATSALDANVPESERANCKHMIRILEDGWNNQKRGVIRLDSNDEGVVTECVRQVTSEIWTEGNFALVWNRVKESSSVASFQQALEYVEIELWSYDIYDKCSAFAAGTLAAPALVEALQANFAECQRLAHQLFNKGF